MTKNTNMDEWGMVLRSNLDPRTGQHGAAPTVSMTFQSDYLDVDVVIDGQTVVGILTNYAGPLWEGKDMPLVEMRGRCRPKDSALAGAMALTYHGCGTLKTKAADAAAAGAVALLVVDTEVWDEIEDEDRLERLDVGGDTKIPVVLVSASVGVALATAEVDALKFQAATFCRCAQTCKDAYAAAVQLLTDEGPWVVEARPCVSSIAEALFATTRHYYLHPSDSKPRKPRSRLAVPIASLCNSLLDQFRAPKVYILEPAGVARPRFEYERCATGRDKAEKLVLPYPAMAQAIRTDEQMVMKARSFGCSDGKFIGSGFLSGEIVALTTFGAEYQEYKIKDGKWVPGGGIGGSDGYQRPLEPKETGVVLRIDCDGDYEVATGLTAEQQLELQSKVFEDEQVGKDYTSTSGRPSVWYYPAFKEVYNTTSYDGFPMDDLDESNRLHEEGHRFDVWLKLADDPALNAHAAGAAGEELGHLRESLFIADALWPAEAGDERVIDYLTKTGDFLHTYQGYFHDSPRAERRHGLEGRRECIDWLAPVIENLQSLERWNTFVSGVGQAVSFEVHMNHSLDSDPCGGDWNPGHHLRPVLYVCRATG